MNKLFEYGENRIIRDLIYEKFPNLKSIHGDAVNIDTSRYCSLSFSTDPCPEPIITYYDSENRYYHYGFLSVVINYSDLAACGSEPIGILLSTVMPNDMIDYEYMSFLNGVKDACNLYGGKLLGGNIKDGNVFSVTGTAIGGHFCNNILTRKGMQKGDVICTVGDLGMFWFGVLQLMEGKKLYELDEYTTSFLTKPRPKIVESSILSKSALVTSCMDNSDGIIGCLYELAEINDLTIHVEDEKLIPTPKMKDFCELRGIDYRNLLFSFGGWDLVFSCKEKDVLFLKELFSKEHLSFSVIGYSSIPTGQPVVLHKGNRVFEVKDISSKRFSNNSYFSFGINSFVKQFYENNLTEVSNE